MHLRRQARTDLMQVVRDIGAIVVESMLNWCATVAALGIYIRTCLHQDFGDIQIVVFTRRKRRSESVHHTLYTYIKSITRTEK